MDILAALKQAEAKLKKQADKVRQATVGRGAYS